MFNIAFPELLVIGVVALIVIGPDKLPKVARTAGLIFGRVQRFTSNLKSELDKELHTEDLQRLQTELRNHDLGLNEELRQGMQPVEAVIHQIREPEEAAVQQNENIAQPEPSLESINNTGPDFLKRSVSK